MAVPGDGQCLPRYHLESVFLRLRMISWQTLTDIIRKRKHTDYLGDLEMPVPNSTETTLLVAGALRTLPEKERAAITLRDIEGLSTREVAEILGSSEATVRSQISSARLKIRKLL